MNNKNYAFIKAPEIASKRSVQTSCLEAQIFDVVIIGGGINGCCTYHYAKQAGLKVALLEAEDFGSQSSQNSGNMIWGGLLYLQNLDFKSVYQFSRSRDQLMQKFPDRITPHTFNFVPLAETKRNPIFDYFALQLYWLFSHCQRKKPTYRKSQQGQKSIAFEEGVLTKSDASFTLSWLNLSRNIDSVCLNYCSVLGGSFDISKKTWELQCYDHFQNKSLLVKTKLILNAAGASVDKVNKLFQVSAPYKHVLSKGVYLNLEIDEKNCNQSLIYEMANNRDVLTYMPWGNVALWGSTEKIIENISDGYTVFDEEYKFLLKQGERLTNGLVSEHKVISTRAGIRALAVPANKDFSDRYGLDISRKHQITINKKEPFVCIYGGKISGCNLVAQQSIKKVCKLLQKTGSSGYQSTNEENLLPTESDLIVYPGIQEKIPSLKWCVDNQYCLTISDYFRRRTNISQWVPNQGLGKQYENLITLQKLCKSVLKDPIYVKQLLENSFNLPDKLAG